MKVLPLKNWICMRLSPFVLFGSAALLTVAASGAFIMSSAFAQEALLEIEPNLSVGQIPDDEDMEDNQDEVVDQEMSEEPDASLAIEEVEANEEAAGEEGGGEISLPGATSAEADEEKNLVAAEPGEVRPVTQSELEIDPTVIPSLLYTYWEHTALMDARNSRGMVRPPTDQELMQDFEQSLDAEPEEKKPKPPPEEREIVLSGISYVNPADWTIWLNGKRVTPDALPKEAVDLQVYENYIEVKWFDDYENQVLPIRLRPHQRFNIDMRIFLPGIY